MPARFYITTAIDYVNGRPHLGHAYEKVLADVIARVHRQRGDSTYFLTGTDEHGQKIARAAAEAGIERRRRSWTALRRRSRRRGRRSTFSTTSSSAPPISATRWRCRSCSGASTTRAAPRPASRCCSSTATRAVLRGLRGLQTGEGPGRRQLSRSTAPSRRRSRRRTSSSGSPSTTRRCSSTSRRTPSSSSPTTGATKCVNVIKEGLQDISVSRPNLPWGIPLPEEIPDSEGHTAYVWADALLNYLSAIGWPDRVYSKWWLAREGEIGGPGAARQDEFQHLDGNGKPGAAWAGTAQPQYTNALHLIGKDISRFHCVLWPALLLAAGVPLPRSGLRARLHLRARRAALEVARQRGGSGDAGARVRRRRAALLSHRRDPDRP